MSDEGRKKISFAFSKKSTTQNVGIHNKGNPNQRQKDDKVEYIESLEGKEFKTIGPKKEEQKELVIPLVSSIPKWQKKLLQQRAEQESKDTLTEKESLDYLAAQELIQDAEAAMQEKEIERKTHTIPLADDADEDKDEPTMNDYANVPVTDFGLALLRGMGWAPGRGIGKNPKVVTPRETTIRPRGMGLGAERPNTSKKEQDDLKLKTGAGVKITQGALKGCYAQVESFDDSCGRVIVRLALGGKTQNICEYMLEVVTAKEYNEKSKLVTSENAAIVKRSTTAVSKSNTSNCDFEPFKEYGLVKRHRSRSPIYRNPYPDN